MATGSRQAAPSTAPPTKHWTSFVRPSRTPLASDASTCVVSDVPDVVSDTHDAVSDVPDAVSDTHDVVSDVPDVVFLTPGTNTRA
ncbi:hypothetical protein GCM10025762_30060 [Haloechinothrix salitolerans]